MQICISGLVTLYYPNSFVEGNEMFLPNCIAKKINRLNKIKKPPHKNKANIFHNPLISLLKDSGLSIKPPVKFKINTISIYLFVYVFLKFNVAFIYALVKFRKTIKLVISNHPIGLYHYFH